MRCYAHFTMTKLKRLRGMLCKAQAKRHPQWVKVNRIGGARPMESGSAIGTAPRPHLNTRGQMEVLFWGSPKMVIVPLFYF